MKDNKDVILKIKVIPSTQLCFLLVKYQEGYFLFFGRHYSATRPLIIFGTSYTLHAYGLITEKKTLLQEEDVQTQEHVGVMQTNPGSTHTVIAP